MSVKMISPVVNSKGTAVNIKTSWMLLHVFAFDTAVSIFKKKKIKQRKTEATGVFY